MKRIVLGVRGSTRRAKNKCSVPRIWMHTLVERLHYREGNYAMMQASCQGRQSLGWLQLAGTPAVDGGA